MNLRDAIAFGLSSEQALRSLTEVPASLIGMENELGTLEAGKIANFMITSSPVFDADNIIYENWVHGSRYVINNLDFPDIKGIYKLQAEGLPDIDRKSKSLNSSQ